MSDQQYQWLCVGHKPTEWALGVYYVGEMRDIKARVRRLESGQWHWRVRGSYGCNGIEPSRDLAIAEAERALSRA